ncbi:hypothetical protein GCM10007383_19480 [Arenibacter certesii]|uniref:Uncharacterized protein n=1 Tax=Arenibacter certesii TaxID=228955 RepID=A0A918MLI8_9FLAO|nr:hypothetical protein GCM10007383_19480 [Arenibacter certesii]
MFLLILAPSFKAIKYKFKSYSYNKLKPLNTIKNEETIRFTYRCTFNDNKCSIAIYFQKCPRVKIRG